MGVGLVVGLVPVDKLSSLVDCLNNYVERLSSRVVTISLSGHVAMLCAADCKPVDLYLHLNPALYTLDTDNLHMFIMCQYQSRRDDANVCQVSHRANLSLC